jgi:hypothetical protein
VSRINPGFTIETSKCVLAYNKPKDVEHGLDGLRTAGLPRWGRTRSDRRSLAARARGWKTARS